MGKPGEQGSRWGVVEGLSKKDNESERKLMETDNSVDLGGEGMGDRWR